MAAPNRRALVVTVLLLAAFAASFAAARAEQAPDMMLHTGGEGVVRLPDAWRFHPGDSLAWADPRFDDSGWELRRTMASVPGALEGWPGMGWYRLELGIPEALRDEPVGVYVVFMGAYQVYVNGRLVDSGGRMGQQPRGAAPGYSGENPPPRFYTLPDTSRMVIAVRFQNLQARELVDGGGFCGFHITLATSNEGLAHLRHVTLWRSALHFALAGVAFSLGFLHFVLFLFDRRRRENLHQAVFNTGITLFILISVVIQSRVEQQHLYWLVGVLKALVIMLPVIGSRVLHLYFFGEVDRKVNVMTVVLAPLALTAFFLPGVLFITAAIVAYGDWILTVIKAAKQGRRGVWLLGAGYIVFMLSALATLFSPFEVTEGIGSFHDWYLVGVDFLLMTMTLSIALAMNRTNRRLAGQMEENRRLYERTLQQEREMKEREIAEAVLAKELEEAREKQKVMDELERTNRELREAQAQLIQSGKMAALGSLVAGVAHEINTPVGAVRSMHDTLQRAWEKIKAALRERLGDPEQWDEELAKPAGMMDEANRVIATGSDRVAEIVKRLRSFARLDEAELKEADLHEGIEDALLLVHHEIKNRIQVVRDYGDLPRVPCYPKQLNQVFLNLLKNAGQAIAGDGTITVRTRHRHGWVTVEVSDTGSGIPEDKLQSIFDPGFTTKGVGVGTGLGLSIVYRIVRDHMGDIEVESEVGRGSTFRVILPTDLDERLNGASDEADKGGGARAGK